LRLAVNDAKLTQSLKKATAKEEKSRLNIK
jgi:hypothetical protein